jgi:group I intron endonuclease
MVIYKVTNKENGKVYIGKTVRELRERKWAHYNSARNSNSDTNFHRALRKYPKNSFQWEVIATTDNNDELNQLEVQFIKEYDSFKSGYNMTEGGTGGFTYKRGTEMYDRIKHKLGKWKDGNPGATPEAISKRLESFKNVDWPKGKEHPNYGRVRLDMRGKPAHNSKPVIVDGIEYQTTGEAAKALGLKDSEVVRKRCISARKWTNYNYK